MSSDFVSALLFRVFLVSWVTLATLSLSSDSQHESAELESDEAPHDEYDFVLDLFDLWLVNSLIVMVVVVVVELMTLAGIAWYAVNGLISSGGAIGALRLFVDGFAASDCVVVLDLTTENVLVLLLLFDSSALGVDSVVDAISFRFSAFGLISRSCLPILLSPLNALLSTKKIARLV